MDFMKRWIGVLLLLSLACVLPSLASPRDAAPPPVTTDVPEEAPTSAGVLPEVMPVPTFTPTPLLPTATLSPSDPRLDEDQVLILPRPLFAGDRLTVDVDPVIPDFQSRHYTVTLDLPDGRSLTSPVSPMGLSGEPRARFYWLPPLDVNHSTAIFTVTLSVADGVVDDIPQNNRIVLPEPMYPRSALVSPEPETQWTYTETTGYRLYYLTGSSADRDLNKLIAEAESAYRYVTARLGEPDEPVDVYIMDRIVGQGGYASSEWVAFSYTDRKYAPITLSSVLRHELTHRLDGALACETAPSFLREGLAVYVAGGHYEVELLRRRAATLLASDHYIPLKRLVNDFYTHQHEVGYWEAGAFVQYLVETYGWESIPQICEASASGAFSDHESDLDILADSVASLGMGSFAAIEREWEEWLVDSETSRLDHRLLEGKLALMDRMRLYQQHYDTAAHFTEGVLFSPAEAERLGIVANFVRRPREPEAIATELLLAMGYESYIQRDLVMLTLCIDSVDAFLERHPHSPLPDSSTDLAVEILEIVRHALAKGYEPYRLLIPEPGRYRLQVLDLQAWPEKREMVAFKDSGAWLLH